MTLQDFKTFLAFGYFPPAHILLSCLSFSLVRACALEYYFELVVLFSYVSKTAVSAIILGGAVEGKRRAAECLPHSCPFSKGLLSLKPVAIAVLSWGFSLCPERPGMAEATVVRGHSDWVWEISPQVCTHTLFSSFVVKIMLFFTLGSKYYFCSPLCEAWLGKMDFYKEAPVLQYLL